MEQRKLSFDPEEIVTLHGQGQMTLRTAVECVIDQRLRGLDATIFRQGHPSILGRVGIEKLAAKWGIARKRKQNPPFAAG